MSNLDTAGYGIVQIVDADGNTMIQDNTPDPSFPTSVWNGTSRSRSSRLDYATPSADDYKSVVDELIAIESFLLNGNNSVTTPIYTLQTNLIQTASSTAPILVRGSLITRTGVVLVADDPETQITLYTGSANGLLMVALTEVGSGLFWCNGTTVTAIEANAIFSTTEDNADTVNIYYDGANLMIQNDSGDTIEVTHNFVGLG